MHCTCGAGSDRRSSVFHSVDNWWDRRIRLGFPASHVGGHALGGGGDSALPFALQFYGSPSSYFWEDDFGVVHTVTQAEGGEQGDLDACSVLIGSTSRPSSDFWFSWTTSGLSGGDRPTNSVLSEMWFSYSAQNVGDAGLHFQGCECWQRISCCSFLL